MYTKLLNNLETLKLDRIRSYLPAYLDTAVKDGVPLVDADQYGRLSIPQNVR